MGTDHQIDHPVVFFDGVCNLCNASVQFVIKKDKAQLFRFASLQSEYAQAHLPESYIKEGDLKSFILKTDGRIFSKSTAALKVTRSLDGGWPLLYVFIIVPKVIRDAVYSLIAKNRYRWFGKQDSCMMPSPELKARFFK